MQGKRKGERYCGVVTLVVILGVRGRQASWRGAGGFVQRSRSTGGHRIRSLLWLREGWVQAVRGQGVSSP